MYYYIIYALKIYINRGGAFLFNIKKPESVNKTFRLPIELVKRLEIIAQQQGVSMNNLVIQSCEYALENLNTKDTSADK